MAQFYEISDKKQMKGRRHRDREMYKDPRNKINGKYDKNYLLKQQNVEKINNNQCGTLN